MRLLCLHGGRTSGAIFRRQLRPLVETMPEADFVFVDGRTPVSTSTPDVERAFPGGPYFEHVERVVEDEGASTGRYHGIDAGVSWLTHLVADQGPFDGWGACCVPPSDASAAQQPAR